MRHSRSSVCLLRVFACLASAATIAGLTGCGTGVNPGFPAFISAASSTIRAGDTLQINSEAKYSGSPVVFSVNGVVGGNATVGTIDSNGMYSAPAIVPTPSNVVTITSTATKYPDATPGSVTLSVLNPIPIIAAVTPSAFSEGSSLITVSGSKFVYGAQIVWNGVAVPTTMVSDTELAAEIAAPKPGTFPLLVANPNPGAANSYVVNELVGPGQVVLTLNTGSGTSARVTNSINIGINVTGTDNTAVKWTLDGLATGNAQIGTIVANQDGSVTYTAPAVVPIPNNVVSLTAVSVDNPSVSITQGVAVLNPIPVLNSATPSALDTSVTTVALSGSHFITGAQLLVDGSAVPTTFNSGSQLTATFTPTTPGPLDLQVLNPGPGPATSTDLIATVAGTIPAPPVSLEDASRFLDQATFGATDSDIHHLSQIGYSAWLSEQFAVPQTLHTPAVTQAVIFNNPPCAASDLMCNSTLFLGNANNQVYVEDSFWQQALTGNDQLRQRVKYTLSEMFVISGRNGAVGNGARGMANYYDLLGYDAFTNFRQLLQDVTLNPMMGLFLSMQGNDKGDANRDPDENYAREVMQLLTIGLYQLNPDGSQVLDGTGAPVPTYGNPDVMGLAKVFTGFSWNVPGDSSDAAWSKSSLWIGPSYGEDLEPMRSYADHHSTDEKNFLGVTISASSSPDADGDLKIALDTLFNHPNVPPFFARQMIQHLVTSNPSPAYVSRVAAAFIDNGSGVRGDMKAVISAVLTDEEARGSAAAAANPQYGKVREALIRYTEWARAFTAQSRNGGFFLNSTEDQIYALGEMPLRSATVFNWFAPGYVPPNTSIEAAGLVAPEMEMTDVSTVVGYLNYMEGAIGSNAQGGADVYSAYSTEVGLASTPDKLLDRLNLLLMAGEMDSNLRSQILTAVNAIDMPTGDQNAIDAALTARVQVAIYLTMAAPSFASQF